MEKQQSGSLWKRMFLLLLVFTLLTNICSREDGILYTQSTGQGDGVGETVQNDVTARFTSVKSKRHCASLCLANTGCTSFWYKNERRLCKLVSKQIFNSGTLVDLIHSRYNIVDCGCPPYQDGAMANYKNTMIGAEANYLCVKGYSTSGSGTAVCLSNGSWSEIDLKCSASSHNTWLQIATTAASTTASNQRDDLKNRISQRCKPKLRVKADFNSWTRVTHINSYGVHWRTGIWGQTVSGLRKTSWNSFATDPEREFEMFVSNGKSSYMFVDDNGTVTKDTLDRLIIWFVKDDQCISKSNSSFKSSVMTNLFEGEVDPYFDTYHADESSSTVCGQRTAFVSRSSTHTFHTPPNWFGHKDCSSGRRNFLKWLITGKYMRTDRNSYKMPWCPDMCWHRVLDTRTSDRNKDKHIRHLTNGVLHGHNIMVKVEHVVAKAREVILLDGHVTVGVKEFWLPANKDDLSSGSLQAWMIASTTGLVVQCTHFPESPSVKEIKEDEKPSIWFLDSREWDKVLTIDGTGSVLSGSKSTLLNKINEGRSLRVSVLHTNGMYKALEVDAVDVSRTGHIAVNIFHNVDLIFGPGNTFLFSGTCRLVSSIISTEGSYKMYRYNIRAGGNHSKVNGVVKIEFFIEM